MLWMLLLFMQEIDEFKEEELAWRQQREESMRAEDSWLNLVGLFWLKEGPNPFGSDPSLRFSLPLYSTVNQAGTIYLEDGRVRFDMARGQLATVDGERRNQGELKMGEVLQHNHLRMFIIERGGKIAIRVRDLRGRKYMDFQALDFYRPKKQYRVEALYFPYEEPRKITITTVVSTEIELWVPGEIHFNIHGKSLSLVPTLESLDDEEFFIMFQDQTSGTTTYSGGRFLYTPKPVEDKIVLDFNRAINPPCAYTDYATCPLPPAENWLEIPIEAGERVYLKDTDY